MYKLVFFVPASALESVKNALFIKGAGADDKYSHCCWQVLGEMQFKSLTNSNPAIGEPGKFTKTQEYRVEMLCKKTLMRTIIDELHRVHPYEKPAYEIYELVQEL